MRHVLIVTVALVTLAVSASAQRGPQGLAAGYAEADVTPPLGGSMPGYFTDRKATGVLDPLKSKVLVLRKGRESVALVSSDMVSIGRGIVRRIRESAAKQARERGVAAPKQIWVHATHTHTGGMLPREGPTSDAHAIYGSMWPGEVDTAWVDRFVDKTAAAVVDAASQLKPEGRVTLAQGREDTVAHYRRFFMKDGSVRTNPGRNNPDVVRPAGEIDPRIHVLRFADTKVLAVVYGLHPDTTGGTLFSGDYPAHLSDALREQLGAGWRVIFLNACCGNINHVDVKNAQQRSGPAEARRIGRTLAAAVVKALESEKPLPVDALEAKTTTVSCRLRRPSEEEVRLAEERVKSGTGLNEFNGLQAPAVLILARTRDRQHPAEIGALRIGSLGLAFMPGEIFVELGREVEAVSPFRPTRTIGLTNGGMGYIPTREGYAQGGYEAGYRSARYEPENGHRWAAAAAGLLKRLDR